MKFTALPVNVGDSFLLQVDNKVILVDGGMNKTHIDKLLSNEKIKHIDLLICTHYDADHINGIIGILKSKKYTFSELWLPEIFGSIGYTISKRLYTIFEELRECRSHYENSLDYEYSSEIIEKNSEENNAFEKINNDSLRHFLEYKPWHRREYRYYHEIEYKMIHNMYNISSLINSSLDTGAYIRWFKFCDRKVHNSYGFDMYCENSIQTDITEYDTTLFFNMLYSTTLSKINQKSLVFMYDNNLYPNVLFCADSNFDFCDNAISLKPSSIVTAPHHGSEANNNVYFKVNGDNLYFIRSDRSQIKRPGRGYLKQDNRYCTICRNKTKKQKIELILDKDIFKTTASKCICYP